MKGLSFILIASFMFFTSGCSDIGKNDDIVIDQSTKQIVFFSDRSTYNQEAPYYDAIVELKKQFPKEFDNMMVLTEDTANKYDDFFEVEKFPAILIFYQDEVLVKINGKVTKEQITDSLYHVLAGEANNEVSTAKEE